jgi:hypothetical protein
LNLD